MYFVYILKSQKSVSKYYIGFTKDISKRLEEHNLDPSCSYTKCHGPWELVSYLAVKNQKTAEELEHYLKHGSGHAFLRKHLI